MSLLQDPVFTLFGGESITGRAPVSMRVIGRDLSGEQRDWAVREFAAFKSACRISIVPLQTKWVKLRDGTVMQMASNAGTDRVVIWPAGGSDSFGPGLYLLWSEEQTLDGSMPPKGRTLAGRLSGELTRQRENQKTTRTLSVLVRAPTILAVLPGQAQTSRRWLTGKNAKCNCPGVAQEAGTLTRS